MVLKKAKICHFWGTVCPHKRVLDNVSNDFSQLKW